MHAGWSHLITSSQLEIIKMCSLTLIGKYDRPVKFGLKIHNPYGNKKLSYCWETVRRESMPRIAEMDVEMTT